MMIEKRQKREEKAASFGGAVRDSVPEDELSGGGARHSDAESEGGQYFFFCGEMVTTVFLLY